MRAKKIAPIMAVAMTGNFATPIVASGVALSGGMALYSNAAHAAAVAPINPKARILNDSDISYPTLENVEFSWTVLKGIKDGDTSTITPKANKHIIYPYLDGTVNVVAEDGTVVGTAKSTGENETIKDITVTYNDKINQHQGSRISFVNRIIFNYDINEKVDDIVYPQFTIDGVDTVNKTSGWDFNQKNNYGPGHSIVISKNDTTSSILFGNPSITKDQIGKKITQELTLEGSNEKDLTFNCDKMADNNGGTFKLYYDIKDPNATEENGTYKSVGLGLSDTDNASYNQLKMSATCTNNKITLSYTMPEKITNFETNATTDMIGKFITFSLDEAIVTTDSSKSTPAVFGIKNSIQVDGKEATSSDIIGSNNYVTSKSAAYASRPTAFDDTANGAFGQPVLIDVAANDKIGTQTFDKISIDGPTVKLIDAKGEKVTTLTNDDGTYVVQADGKVLFTPKAGFSGKAKDVEYQINDTNKTPTDYAKISATIDAAAAPKANPDMPTFDYGKGGVINVLTNDVINQKGATWKSVDLQGKNGKLVKELTTTDGKYLVNKDNTVTFTPSKGFTGKAKDPVTYVATDSNGETSTSTITVMGKAAGTKPVTPVTPVKPVTPKPVVTPTKPVVGPTVQTDMLNGNSSDAAGIAGVAVIAGLMSAAFIGSKRKK